MGTNRGSVAVFMAVLGSAAMVFGSAPAAFAGGGGAGALAGSTATAPPLLTGADTVTGQFAAANAAIGPLHAVRLFYSGALPDNYSKVGVPAGVTAFISYKTPSTNTVPFAKSCPPGTRIIFHHEPENEYNGNGAAFVAQYDQEYTTLKTANPALIVGMAAMSYQYSGGRYGQSGSYLPAADHVDFYAVDTYEAKPDGTGLATDAPFMGWYNLVKDRGKPLVFAEYGVGANPVGYTADNWSAQRAATMIADKTWIAAHPAFTTLLYWYNTGARGDWRFTDAASIAAWKVLQTTGKAPAGPAFARRDATITLTGGAQAGAPVQVWLHKRNNSGYVTQTVTADGSGAWSFSYTASDDYRYYTTSSEGTSPGGLTQLEPYVSGPAEAAAGSTVPLTGTARPDSTLTVWFHKQNTIGYTARRTITADGTGSWSTSYTANDDYRYYARDNNTGRASNTELTQIG